MTKFPRNTPGERLGIATLLALANGEQEVIIMAPTQAALDAFVAKYGLVTDGTALNPAKCFPVQLRPA